MTALSYVLSMPRPESHLLHVEMRLTDLPADRDRVDVQLPAWTPGSYKIRDFARHVQDFTAEAGGRPAEVERLDKQTWRIRTGRAKEAIVRYKVFAHELTVRGSHLDETHAYLNGTNVWMYVVGQKDLPASVEVRPPAGWYVDTGLPRTGAPGEWRFEARDYDHLGDCPMEIGPHRRLTFEVQGKEHVIALYGHGNENEERLREDVKRIVEEEAAVFGNDLPYDRYVFIVHLADKGGGGLEHENSNTSSVDRWTFQPPKKYEDFLALEAHEFFHTWNVKRIRPKALGPFDYSREVHTTLLWAMEGITSYYDHLALARAGLLTEDRYREFLAESITKLRKQPGRLKMSLEESSWLTWIGLYQQDEHWVNKGVSYYLKGELVAMCLDLAIRDRTDGAKGLDDVMQALWERHGKTGEGIDEAPGWRRVLEDVTGLDWGEFWAANISGAGEVDFEGWLRRVGWELKPVYPGQDGDGKGDYKHPGAWLGVNMDEKHGRVTVSSVLSDSPAEAGGLAAGDELVAADGYRVESVEWLKKRLREKRPGDTMEVVTFKRDELFSKTIALGEVPPEKWKLEARKGAGDREKRLREGWLASRAGPRRERPTAGGTPGKEPTRDRMEEKGE